MPYKTIIELEKLKEHFHEPMADVARKFGVCTTFFKRICRIYGIKRWPFRKLQSIDKKIHMMTLGDQSAQTKVKLAQLRAVREHLQQTGIVPLNSLDDDKSDGGFDGPMFVQQPVPTMGLVPFPMGHPMPHPPTAVRNDTGGLTLVLHGDDHMGRKQSQQPQSLVPCESGKSPTKAVDPGDDVEEVSQILGKLARETLFQHSVFSCSSAPEEHSRCIERFDSIQGGAVYIFEVGPTGDPSFKYISRGSYDVYGLTPDQVTHPDGCQSILGVIHDDDQPSFLESVQESRVKLTEWIWSGRTRVPSGADEGVFKEETFKGIYARSIPEKFSDGTVRWEGFLMEVEPQFQKSSK